MMNRCSLLDGRARCAVSHFYQRRKDDDRDENEDKAANVYYLAISWLPMQSLSDRGQW